VAGGGRNAADCVDQLVARYRSGLCEGLVADEFSEGRCAGDGRNASFRLKTDVGNRALGNCGSEFQDIAASGVLELYRGMRFMENAGVARVLEMIEELRGIHVGYCRRLQALG